MKKGIDPLTGDEFYKKRNNQKFATKANQIKFNNNKAYQKRQIKSFHDRILDRSRDVLINVLGDNEYIEKSYDFLHGAGLHFGYYTHQISNEDVKWICIYDYAYTMVGPNLFRIIRINIKQEL